MDQVKEELCYVSDNIINDLKVFKSKNRSRGWIIIIIIIIIKCYYDKYMHI